MDFLNQYGDDDDDEELEVSARPVQTLKSAMGGQLQHASNQIQSNPMHTASSHAALPPPDFDSTDVRIMVPMAYVQQPSAATSSQNLKRPVQPSAVKRAGLAAGPSKVARTGDRPAGGGASTSGARGEIKASDTARTLMLPPQLKGRANLSTEDLTKFGLSLGSKKAQAGAAGGSTEG